MNKEINRIDWIDALKGIGILLVILGHAPALNIREYIFTFHMQLFFFISGFLFEVEKYPTFTSFLKRKVKSLLLPYLSFSIISIVAGAVLLEIHTEIKPTLHAVFVSTRNHMPFNEALWFLTCMFLVEIMFYTISKIAKYDSLKLALAIAVCVVGSTFYSINVPKLPWTFDSAMFFVVFFAIGYVFKKWKLPDFKYFKSLALLCLFVNFVILIRHDVFYRSIDYLHLGMILTFVVTAMISVIAYLEIAKLTQRSRLLIHLGRNSLIYFGLHQAVAFPIIRKIFSIFNINVDTNQSNVLGIIFVAISILILFPIVNVINNYFPFMLGKFSSNTELKKTTAIQKKKPLAE